MLSGDLTVKVRPCLTLYSRSFGYVSSLPRAAGKQNLVLIGALSQLMIGIRFKCTRVGPIISLPLASAGYFCVNLGRRDAGVS